jgi:large subunit ribosomal protein L17
MRHKNSFSKLGRNPSHRRALMRNLATALVINSRIETTLANAKELKRVADKLVTLGKKDNLHARRLAMSYLMTINREEVGNAGKLSAVHKLFTEIAPQYSERAGGYTRVVRTRKRVGDNAQMAVIEFVEGAVKAPAAGKKKRRVVKKSKDVSSETVEQSAE